jgi:DNA polymerase-3 subunit delta'
MKVSNGCHPDLLLYLSEELTIKISEMRQLRKEAQYRPFEGRCRFFIVDEAERMTREAANCILKTLEEPPPTSKIILVTAYPERLLPTIRSRCQSFRFSSLAFDELTDFLSKRSVKQPSLVARFSGGSPGKAMGLDLNAELKARDLMLEMASQCLIDPEFTAIFEHCEKSPLKTDLRKRERVLVYLRHLKRLLHDLYFLKVDCRQKAVNSDRLTDLEPLAEQLSVDWLRRFLALLAQAERDVEGYVNPLICFQTLWLGMRRSRPEVPAP